MNLVKLLVRRSIVPTLCLLLGMGIGHLLTRNYPVESTARNYSVKSALQCARKECERELYSNADFSQLDLNICSSFLRRLAEMELAWRRIEVENSVSYSKIKTDYMKWSLDWEKRLKEDLQHPSDFAGGSMEMMDITLRQYRLLCIQLEELESLWEDRLE